jgi:hypothetical protein
MSQLVAVLAGGFITALIATEPKIRHNYFETS